MDKNLESLKAVLRKGFEKADSRNEYTNEPRSYFESQITAIAECLQEDKYRKADKVSEELKNALSDAIRSFTRMETLYKLKCNELEIANDKIAGLTGKCEALQKDNENLRLTLEEQREIIEEAKKETATRIYQKLYELCTKENPFGDYDLCKEDVLDWAKEDGIGVDE